MANRDERARIAAETVAMRSPPGRAAGLDHAAPLHKAGRDREKGHVTQAARGFSDLVMISL